MESSTLILVGVGLIGAFLLFRIVVANRSRLTKDQLMTLLDQKVLILDVRSPQEFAQGHAPGSVNVPLDRLAEHMPKLVKSKPILVCCASGARSGAAKAILDSAGFTQVSNAGPWQRLLRAKPWIPIEVKQLAQKAKGNTPTRVIALHMDRTPDAIYAKASDEGISLKPTNQAPYNRQ